MTEYRRLIEWLILDGLRLVYFSGRALATIASKTQMSSLQKKLVRTRNVKEKWSFHLGWIQRKCAKKSNGWFFGIKVYHLFVRDEPTWNSDISGFLIEDHVRVANEEG